MSTKGIASGDTQYTQMKTNRNFIFKIVSYDVLDNGISSRPENRSNEIMLCSSNPAVSNLPMFWNSTFIEIDGKQYPTCQ